MVGDKLLDPDDTPPEEIAAPRLIRACAWFCPRDSAAAACDAASISDLSSARSYFILASALALAAACCSATDARCSSSFSAIASMLLTSVISSPTTYPETPDEVPVDRNL